MTRSEINERLEEFTDKHLHLYAAVLVNGSIHLDGRFSIDEHNELTRILHDLGTGSELIGTRTVKATYTIGVNELC